MMSNKLNTCLSVGSGVLGEAPYDGMNSIAVCASQLNGANWEHLAGSGETIRGAA